MAKQQKKKYNKPNYKYKKLDDKVDFGQHKSKTIEEVIESEPMYLEWALNNVRGFSLSAGIKSSLKKRLGRELRED